MLMLFGNECFDHLRKNEHELTGKGGREGERTDYNMIGDVVVGDY